MIKKYNSDYQGKHIVCNVKRFASYNQKGVVTEVDTMGGLTIKWDTPNRNIGDTGFLFSEEVDIISETVSPCN